MVRAGLLALLAATGALSAPDEFQVDRWPAELQASTSEAIAQAAEAAAAAGVGSRHTGAKTWTKPHSVDSIAQVELSLARKNGCALIVFVA